VPIIGIGFYPKLLTQIYDTKTAQIIARIRDVNPVLVAQKAEARILAERVDLTQSALPVEAPVLR
jgi:hypothetical protein